MNAFSEKANQLEEQILKTHILVMEVRHLITKTGLAEREEARLLGLVQTMEDGLGIVFDLNDQVRGFPSVLI